MDICRNQHCILSLIPQIEGLYINPLSVKGTPKNVLINIPVRCSCSPMFPEWHSLNITSTEIVFKRMHFVFFNIIWKYFSPMSRSWEVFGGRGAKGSIIIYIICVTDSQIKLIWPQNKRPQHKCEIEREHFLKIIFRVWLQVSRPPPLFPDPPFPLRHAMQAAHRISNATGESV